LQHIGQLREHKIDIFDLERHSARSEKKEILNVSRGLKHIGQLEEQKLDILIVDDSGLSRKMLCRLLCTTGIYI
jgi:PleD family two-component response regulator